MKTSFVVLLLLLTQAGVYATDKETASAYAASATKLANEGKTEMARDICYKALAQDENCPEALYELGIIFEKDGNNVTAADFLVRASRELAREETSTPGFATKRNDADARLKHLNEYAGRFASLLADYTLELNGIARKMPDSLTLDEACDRVDALNLRTVLPPDKGPKFERPVAATTVPATPGKSKTNNMDDEEMPMRGAKKRAPTSVPPDVERALKTNGWTTITGTWKKKSENVYEVTDGRLETSKLMGGVQVAVHKGSGNVSAFVRNNNNQYTYYSSSGMARPYSSGYGCTVLETECKLFTPYSYYTSASSFRPRYEHSVPLVGEKNVVRVTVDDTKLELYVNDKKVKSAPYKLPKEGPFIIDVEGTMVIEDPRAVGQ